MNLKTLLSQISRDDLNEVLFSCLRSVHKFERTKVKSFGLNYEAIFLLQFLRRHSPATMSDIADEMDIPISTASRVVDRLQAKDLVARSRDEKDKRIILVSLKATGEKIVREVEDHTLDIISGNLADFDADQIKSFIEAAVHMDKILNVQPD